MKIRSGALETIRRYLPILILEAFPGSILFESDWFAQTIPSLGQKKLTDLRADAEYVCGSTPRAGIRRKRAAPGARARLGGGASRATLQVEFTRSAPQRSCRPRDRNDPSRAGYRPCRDHYSVERYSATA